MKTKLLAAAWLLVCISLGAQTSQRDSVLSEARYLKSIYRTDDAIEMLSALVQPGSKGYETVSKNIAWIKGELFMEGDEQEGEQAP